MSKQRRTASAGEDGGGGGGGSDGDSLADLSPARGRGRELVDDEAGVSGDGRGSSDDDGDDSDANRNGDLAGFVAEDGEPLERQSAKEAQKARGPRHPANAQPQPQAPAREVTEAELRQALVAAKGDAVLAAGPPEVRAPSAGGGNVITRLLRSAGVEKRGPKAGK